MSIAKHLPDPEHLLALEPEELAGLLLQYLNALPSGEKNALNRYNFSLRHTVQDYPAGYQDPISRALMEAWVWLEREGFLASPPEAGEPADRGREARERTHIRAAAAGARHRRGD